MNMDIQDSEESITPHHMKSYRVVHICRDKLITILVNARNVERKNKDFKFTFYLVVSKRKSHWAK